MNKRELEILKIGFNAGKKAIEMHPENDEYDTIRFNEAQELVKNLDISLVSNRTFIVTIECGENTSDWKITALNKLAAKMTASSNYKGKQHKILRCIEYDC